MKLTGVRLTDGMGQVAGWPGPSSPAAPTPPATMPTELLPQPRGRLQKGGGETCYLAERL